MNKNEIEAILLDLQAKLSNLKIAIAVPMGMLMIVYFFTYATLIDKGMMGAFYLEVVTTAAFVLSLIYLNPLGFILLRWRYQRHRQYGPLLRLVNAQSMTKSAASLCNEVADRFPQA